MENGQKDGYRVENTWHLSRCFSVILFHPQARVDHQVLKKKKYLTPGKLSQSTIRQNLFRIFHFNLLNFNLYPWTISRFFLIFKKIVKLHLNKNWNYFEKKVLPCEMWEHTDAILAKSCESRISENHFYLEEILIVVCLVIQKWEFLFSCHW